MKIIRAEESGFCFGVKKALDRINSIKNKENIYVLGKLIHNPQVMDELKQQGIIFVETLDEVKGGTLVISAHGVSDDIIQKAEQKGLDIIDTTCPLVRNVHNITKDLQKQGYRIIIFGDKNHAEVKGIQGNLKDPLIINSIEDLTNLEHGKYALVSQTTQEVVEFNKLSEHLKENSKRSFEGLSNKFDKKIKDLIIKDTICSATKQRQENALKVAAQSDLMVVIGGYNSANTKRLKDICSKITETKHIEKADELNKEWFQNKNTIGITAGASTPEKVIQEVIGKITNF
ncbi:MAG: 4-hydroxy-3-methylbut-2-enyl diphosphate reductase [Nanoarchaeota archaeon]|nr:4-hydroxy-3-methylbut-2-enyl diphosphate reductase [Nanoarchaeota archaeon]MBU1005798.1 4-hydroxy-3-methylbut-2-enyl diphosphate reductase [Nanoarchaeota archaeon]MBU1946570.1 4-hydroxy-3-methylbut-2-enyl diphosphate reductase [Nanoarchaeota archaeon]